MTTKITAVLQTISRGPADEKVPFAVSSTSYEIDLNHHNASAFRQQLAAPHRTRPQGRARIAPRAGCVP